MRSIKNIELLPQFYAEVKKQYATVDLRNGKFVVALMADFIPGAVELKRCVRLAYESNAMECIIDISRNMSNVVLLRNKALERMIDYSFMDKQIATEVIDGIIVAIYPQLNAVLQTVHSAQINVSPIGSKVDSKEERKAVLARLATVLHNKLRKDVDEQLLIYKLFGMAPPEEYRNIK